MPKRTFLPGVLTLLLLTAPLLTDADAREVSIDTDLGTLAGTLLLPEGQAPTAAVLLIAGSGPTDRDGNTRGLPGKNNSLLMLAEALAAQGVASLRFDKRLLGASASPELSEAELRFDTYVDDTILWADFLATTVDAPLFVAGHSEGGLIALLAAGSIDLSGVIVIAGPGRPAADVIRTQTQQQLPPDLYAATDAILSELEAGRTVADTPAALDALFRASVQPYLISWFQYDPAAVAAALDVPLLLIYGSTDIQVTPADGERIAAASPAAKLTVIDGMNHILKRVEPDRATQLRSYSDPSLPVVAELPAAIIAFVHALDER